MATHRTIDELSNQAHDFGLVPLYIIPAVTVITSTYLIAPIENRHILCPNPVITFVLLSIMLQTLDCIRLLLSTTRETMLP